MYGWHWLFDKLGLNGDLAGLGLGAVDRRPHGRRPHPAHPALRAADPLLAADAAHPARDAEDPEEVQGQARPGVPEGAAGGDHGSLPAHRDQPVQQLSADPHPEPRSSSRSSSCSTTSRRRPRACRPRAIGPITQEVAQQIESSTIFGAKLSDSFVTANGNLNVQILTRRPHHPDVGDDVHDAVPADAQEHAGSGARQPVREAAEGPALPDADLLRDLRHQLPDRCPHLLAHDQPVDDGPAVLRHPQHARAGLRGRAAME